MSEPLDDLSIARETAAMYHRDNLRLTAELAAGRAQHETTRTAVAAVEAVVDDFFHGAIPNMREFTRQLRAATALAASPVAGQDQPMSDRTARSADVAMTALLAGIRQLCQCEPEPSGLAAAIERLLHEAALDDEPPLLAEVAALRTENELLRRDFDAGFMAVRDQRDQARAENDELKARLSERRRCAHKWASGQDNNPHECNLEPTHLARHLCGCGARA